MNGPAPAKPLRFIVEASIPQLHELVQPLLAWLTPRGQPTTTPPDPDDEDADEPEERTADPPAVNLPPAVADIPAGYTLGPLCQRGHRYQGTRQTLRRLSNGKCAQCERLLAQRRQVSRPHEPAPRPVLVEATATTRPELPAHLALTAFLSPITCAEASHRYRDMPQWTLRYSADETCVMCTTHQSQRALAGD